MPGRSIPRTGDRALVERLLREFPVAALLGARQVGKSTLARQVFSRVGGRGRFFDLEDSRDAAALEDPMLALEPLRGLVVLDEIQRRPGLFPSLRVLADRPGRPARFLVLGSASPDLLRQSSETLAGRIGFHVLRGFSLRDVGPPRADRLWLRGGFPPSYLAGDDAASLRWRDAFVRTFLERDLAGLGVGIPPASIGRFWAMLAHYHGQTWNGAELARSLAVGESTVRRYLDALHATLVVDVLPPWHENLSKRQVKSPRVFVADTGILHALLGVRTPEDLARHPKVGASWEGFAQSAILRRLGTRPGEAYFWATHAGADLDLLVVRGRRRLGFEFKRTSSPTVTRSMQIARADLRLEELLVVHAGAESFPMAAGIRAVALRRLLREVPLLE
jgi:hypothetical protein